MNGEVLFEAFADIDGGFIDEPFPSKTAKRIRMLKIGIAAALVVLALIPFSLFRENTSKDTAASYTIVQENGKYYLSFPTLIGTFETTKLPDPCEPPSSPSYNSGDYMYSASIDVLEIAYCISFQSIYELRDDFLTESFTQDELSIIRNMAWLNDGRVTIPNLSALYEPTLPDELQSGEVSWSGDEEYSFSINYREEPVSRYGVVSILSEENYRNVYYCRFDPAYTPASIADTVIEQTSDRNATIYYSTDKNGHESKIIRYSIKNTAGSELFILEFYSGPDDTVPSSIYILGEDSGAYFSTTIYELQQRPSVEWLSEFGLSRID